jgi:hypothetical protein
VIVMTERSRIPSTRVWVLSLLALAATAGPAMAQNDDPVAVPTLFATAHQCMNCHGTLTGPDGEDISIADHWQASMMAHAARDPYWQAAVRREVLDHPTAAAAIEDTCARCHMPMARYQANAEGRPGQVFGHLSGAKAKTEAEAEAVALALDGVSCTLCHQIQPDHLGEEASFSGGFVIDTTLPQKQRPVFGPYETNPGTATRLHTANGFVPVKADHLATSEVCATCHTLITETLNEAGEVIGELPEQVPYLEWRHSAFAGAAGAGDARHCQDCHMPEVAGEAPISKLLAVPRQNVSRHIFRGGNFFMLRLLARYAKKLEVTAPPEALIRTAERTEAFLSTESARVTVDTTTGPEGRLVVEVAVENRAGHKLPTAYPSRRAWLHLTVKDGAGGVVFESGALQPDGSIRGNDNDADSTRYEPHYQQITQADQVQIYEAILVDPQGAVTTGLLRALAYTKDNRLLPAGFDKASAEERIAVHGAAVEDQDFTASGDRVTYRVDPAGATGPFTVAAELLYQPIAYRWADNLRAVDAPETKRFVGYYDAMAGESAVVLAAGASTIGGVTGGEAGR